MATPIQDGGGLGQLASITSLLAPLILGSGTKKTSETTTPTNNPDLLALLQSITTQANNNANDPAAANATVQDIIRKATLAFAPQLGAEGRSGLYNSSTISQLAKETTADATSAASQAVLGYQTQQRSIAAQGAGTLLNATRSTTTGQQQVTSPPIPSTLLGAGLLGLQLYSKKDAITKFLGLGKDATDTAAGASTVVTPAASELSQTNPLFEAGRTASDAAPSVANIVSGGAADTSSLPLPPLFVSETDAAAGAEAGAGGSSILDTLGGESDAGSGGLGDILDLLTGAGSQVADTVTDLGTSIADAGDGALDLISKLFSI